jgi:hypothetical protein
MGYAKQKMQEQQDLETAMGEDLRGRGYLSRCPSHSEVLIDEGEAGDTHAIIEEMENDGTAASYGTREELFSLIQTAVGQAPNSCPYCQKNWES